MTSQEREHEIEQEQEQGGQGHGGERSGREMGGTGSMGGTGAEGTATREGTMGGGAWQDPSPRDVLEEEESEPGQPHQESRS